jgi:hypothetical protein
MPIVPAAQSAESLAAATSSSRSTQVLAQGHQSNQPARKRQMNNKTHQAQQPVELNIWLFRKQMIISSAGMHFSL